MNKELITVAIHQREKAGIVKKILDQNGITTVIEEMVQDLPQGQITLGYNIKVHEKDLTRAMAIIGTNKLLSYGDKQTFKYDDGKQRILIPVDFSENSIKACEVAFQIAKEMDAKVKILNVFQNMRYPLHMPFADVVRGDHKDGILDKARKNMLDLCYGIDKKIEAGDMPSINYSYSLREGIVEEEIENFIDEYKPSLLVLGMKGMDNNQSSIIGNVTADIIEITNVPILAVPKDVKVGKLSEIKHVAYLTNVDRRELESFDVLVSFFKLYNAKGRITLLHVNHTSKGSRFNEEQLAGMQQYFQTQYPEINIGYKLIDTDNLMDAVEEFVEKEDVSMICLNTRKRNFLGRIFMPSMSRKLLKNINISLMILRGGSQ